VTAALRVRVEELDGGGRVVSVACQCARVGRTLTTWESIPDALAELRTEHPRLAPLCRHAVTLAGERA
jgi:hypothetical protein